MDRPRLDVQLVINIRVISLSDIYQSRTLTSQKNLSYLLQQKPSQSDEKCFLS